MLLRIDIEPGDRDAILLALAILSLERPGWREYMGTIGEKFGTGGRDSVEMMRDLHANRPNARPAADPEEFPLTKARGTLGEPNDTAEAELRIGVRVEGGIVTLHFGKSVTYVGMPPVVARKLATTLLENAERAEAES